MLQESATTREDLTYIFPPKRAADLTSLSFRTMIIVTHEMGFAKEVANRVIFIDDGVIKEDRPPQEFFSDPHDPRLQDFLSKVLI